MTFVLTEKERRMIELARFINVDKAIEILSKRAKAEGELGLDTRSTKFAFSFIERQPEADVVEVVRCKNCRYADDCGTICHYSVGKAVEPEHFCSYGERREDDE